MPYERKAKKTGGSYSNHGSLLHVLQRCLDALAAFRCGSLLAGDAGRLEVLPSSGFRNNRLLLHTLGEAPEKALKTLAVVDSNFYQQFS